MQLPFSTLSWQGELPGALRLLDQTLLPAQEVYIDLVRLDDVVDAIQRLAVRGAPAIGCSAAYGLVVGVQDLVDDSTAAVRARLGTVAPALIAARPTAVNLEWAVRRVLARLDALPADASGRLLVETALAEARAIEAEDVEQCLAMGRHGAGLLPREGARLLTHCNAGALATAGIGTALAPMYTAHDQGVPLMVYADETRPLLQGARITSWELTRAGIPVTLITDGMSASVIGSGRVDAIFVGSDRVARNGDVCNKIGTYAVALAARAHGIPFYVVAPLSTFDPESRTGADIPIEERDPDEVRAGALGAVAPSGVAVYNPAFDVTPAELVTALVTERGVLERPNLERVEGLLREGGRIA
ncbi:Methylthioribose-1-phosphate isomerase [Planctomycetes bacterium Pla163]|uniref:Methylthioribose-1-phosphate isomerase n=1 Tax=Rohdeia mirabilis TaxID=2528008 RepID=A0A518D0H5_9BACT|nr:Methylthioribose-1-phosphate isomerase [Planctomycetes bacterium Pla163]